LGRNLSFLSDRLLKCVLTFYRTRVFPLDSRFSPLTAFTLLLLLGTRNSKYARLLSQPLRFHCTKNRTKASQKANASSNSSTRIKTLWVAKDIWPTYFLGRGFGVLVIRGREDGERRLFRGASWSLFPRPPYRYQNICTIVLVINVVTWLVRYRSELVTLNGLNRQRGAAQGYYRFSARFGRSTSIERTGNSQRSRAAPFLLR
jgi:hypothetical protein